MKKSIQLLCTCYRFDQWINTINVWVCTDGLITLMKNATGSIDQYYQSILSLLIYRSIADNADLVSFHLYPFLHLTSPRFIYIIYTNLSVYSRYFCAKMLTETLQNFMWNGLSPPFDMFYFSVWRNASYAEGCQDSTAEVLKIIL
jgi:hypothetical protein